MKRVVLFLALCTALVTVSCNRYETVADDPLHAKIYTLNNGLKVYMSVNKDEPRIQTYMAVRVGGKDDPADNTGLAHYLEHMMFKGTHRLGTQDFSREFPMLVAIDSLFEVYRTRTDAQERERLYHQIDSISYEASKLAIPNEYDKLMTLIGSDGSNAFTSEDVTCYVEEIPSNQVDNWARIEADRFMNCVFRGFHTELEAVYEEKNMSMADDSEKAIDALNAMLYPNHPYGRQTVIGTQEHLKNPSIRAIRRQKNTYYVPNNMAICLSGDFDPDKMVEIIEKYFGAWKPNPALAQRMTSAPARPAGTPSRTEVLGQESEFLLMGWRTEGAATEEGDISNLVSSVLNNGLAGIMDLALVQDQKVLNLQVSAYNRTEGGILLMDCAPKEGQTLEQVEALLMEQVERLKKGDFPDDLVDAVKANYKLAMMRSLENNASRAGLMMNSFVDGISWAEKVRRIHKTYTFTKEDIVAWAQKYLVPENLAVVYKRHGVDPSIERIAAPKITPLVTNRDKQSVFLQEIAQTPVEPIEPVFVDYSKDMVRDSYKGLEVLYKHNDKNDLAYLTFWYDIGGDRMPALDLAMEYVRHLGTRQHNAHQIAEELYRLASQWKMNVSSTVTTLSLIGLGESTAPMLEMSKELMFQNIPDEEILGQLKADNLQSRADAKKSQNKCNTALQRYLMFGPDYIKKTTLSNAQLQALTSEQLLADVHTLLGYQHKILYYGPASLEEVKAMLDILSMDQLKPLESEVPSKVLTTKPKVLLANYKSSQFRFMQYSNRGESLILEQAPYIELFNEYYGTGTNSIVFQEMREARALAYTAGANLVRPSFTNNDYYFRATIASQNDKLKKAVQGFSEIIETMPESQANLDFAKSAILNKIRSHRIHGISVLYSYMRIRGLGLTIPREKLLYDKVGDLTMFDLLSTHDEWIRNRTYHYAVLGDLKDLDRSFMSTLGPIQEVSLEEIFGY